MLYELLDFPDSAFPAGLGWHDKIVEGFPQRSLWCLSRHLGVDAQDTAKLVGLPLNQLDWKKRGEKVSPLVSDRLFKIARAYQRLMVLFKDEALVQAWLRNTQPALDSGTPVILLLTQQGAEQVFAEIERIKPLKTVEMNPLFEDSDDSTDEEARTASSEDNELLADDELTELQ